MPRQSILTRLDASAANCECCREAAEHIRQMRKAYADDLKEVQRDARDAYTEGKFEGRQEAAGNGGW